MTRNRCDNYYQLRHKLDENQQMIVCNCTGISNRDVTVAISNGAEKWDEVHAHFDREPCCGKCESEIADALAEHRKQNRPPKAHLFKSTSLAAVT